MQHLFNFSDFEKASLALIHTKDVDPVYPFLKSIIKHEKFDPETAIFMYVYYYSIESMVLFMRGLSDGKSPIQMFEKISRFGMERGRTPQVRRVENFEKAFDRWTKVEATLKTEPLDFNSGRELFKTIPYFGDWACYKTCELMDETLGYSNLRINGLGIEASDPNKNTGPVFGLRYLYGINQKFTKDVIPEWEALGWNLSKIWNAPIGQVESCLCKVPKILHKGSYVVGHDINEFLILKKPELYSDSVFWDLIDECGFNHKFLQHHFSIKEKTAYIKNKQLLFVEDVV
jgi:hypothetical protein